MPQFDAIAVKAVQGDGPQFREDGEHLRRGDRPEQGEGGRDAALRGVGQYLPGTFLSGMARLDFEHCLGG